VEGEGGKTLIKSFSPSPRSAKLGVAVGRVAPLLLRVIGRHEFF